MNGALAGIRVLDFSTLLPGPLATLMLAEAGAEVIKIERPEGEAGRVDAAVFAILNSGKGSIAIDLKRDADRLRPLIERTDILVEQFRPGAMDRLGLGYEAVRAINPRILYVSINGYGGDGPDALRPGHDLTYQAEAGVLALNADAAGNPALPGAMTADIGGGSYAAVANVALALYRRERTGLGARLEIAMFDGLMPFLAEPMAHAASGRLAAPGYSPATGSSPRYNIYRTADGRHLALACAEDKFWYAFCGLTGLARDADRDAVAARLGEGEAADWMRMFEGVDLCCSIVATPAEALASPRVARLRARAGGRLPVPIAACLRTEAPLAPTPTLGSANGLASPAADLGDVFVGDR